VKASLSIHIVALSLAFVTLAANADPYKAGDSFIGFKAADQHGVAFTFKPGITKFVIFDTPGESGTSVSPQSPDWFEQHHAILVINVTELSTFKRRIAQSRMEAKPFRLLVVDDKTVAARFPQQKAKFTVLLLDDAGKVTEIRFVAPGKELQSLLAGEK
jgi:hypothetical protein